MSRAFRMTEVFAQVFEIIEASYERTLDSDSVSSARFITHLRYLFVRASREGEPQEIDGVSQPSLWPLCVRMRPRLRLRAEGSAGVADAAESFADSGRADPSDDSYCPPGSRNGGIKE